MSSILHHRGYTAMELIAALAIWAAIAGVAAPAASRIFKQHQLATTARRIGFEIVRTRMQAVGQNRYMRIALLGNAQYQRQSSEDGITYVADGEAVTLPIGFTVSAGTSGTPRFDRQGLGTATTIITVNSPRGQQLVTTTILGGVKIS